MDFSTLACGFVKDLRGFDYALSCRDHVWDILFPDQAAQWHRLHITKYERVFYIAHVNGGDQILHVEPGKAVMPADFTGRPLDSREWDEDDRDQVWSLLITSVRRWMKAARKDWMAAARRVRADFPPGYRYGIVPNAPVRASLPDAYRLDKELGKTKTRKLISLVERGFFMREENTTVATMTAEDYFNYCRIAYLAGQRKRNHRNRVRASHRT